MMQNKWIGAALALLLGASAAQARWEQVGESDTLYLFADRDSIQREGDIARMQHLLDYKEHQPEGIAPYQSWRVDAEYNCATNRSRELSASFFPYRLGEGRELSATRFAGAWQPVPPDTGLDQLARIACNRPEVDKKPKPIRLAKPISPLRKP